MGSSESRPESIDELAAAVCSAPRLRPRGGGTKSALSSLGDGETTSLHLDRLTGVLEYEPGEYTITALAGTRVSEISQTLESHGQYLPFDPPWVDAGATLGGTVATGLSGAGRQRYGGARDFLIGVRFVDGEGRLLRGGGKVVKNAAGFDFPKLFVGSIGELGVLADLTFKVFPLPAAWRTFSFECDSPSDAFEAVATVARSNLDAAAIDLVPPSRVLVRFGGEADSLDARARRTRELLATPLEETDDPETWRCSREFEWCPDGDRLVKVPTSPRLAERLEAELAPSGCERRYSSGANVAWVAWPTSRSLDDLAAVLEAVGASGLVLRSDAPLEQPLLAVRPNPFLERVRAVLDPHRRFQRRASVEVES